MQRFAWFITVITYTCFQSISGIRSQANMLPLIDILFDNIGTCDMQILHDGLHSNIDWSNANLPFKIIKMSQFSPADYEHQRIRETKSRAASHCKVALILSAPYVDPDGISLKTDLNLDEYIFSAMYAQFQFELWSSVMGDSEFRYFVAWTTLLLSLSP